MSIVGDIGVAQLGRRIAQLREQTGMKQADLARHVTWSQAVLSRIEGGERPISDEELEIVLRAIGTPDALELSDALRRNWMFLPRPALDHPDQDVLWSADQAMATLTELANRPDVRKPFERRLTEYIDEIRRLAGLLLQREHQIAFVGSIGIGKSTAICRASTLEVAASGGRPQPVLETGAGGITLCEVHIRVGPGHGVVVEPRSHDEIRADVADFVDQLLRSGQPPVGGTQEETLRAVPREIERAIRNMADLRPKRSKDPDGKTVRTDPARALAEAKPAHRELVVEVLTRMDLQRRDKRDEWFVPGSASGPLDWMRSTFAAINNGRHPDFSLPARIELVVPELLSIGDVAISIVDTRGIDQLTARADLEAHLQDPHTISILCSGFNAAPEQSVMKLLERARDINNPQIDANCSVLVLARPDEAMAVKDESGMAVESNEDGYELKREQVSTALGPYALEKLPVGFFNAFEDDPQRLREFLDERVTHTRTEFRRRLDEVLANAQNLTANVEQEQVQEVQRDAARHVTSWIGRHAAPPAVESHIQDTLLAVIRSVHPGTVHAAVRREGEWQSLSYSHQLGHGARRLAVATLRDSVEGFGDLCATLSVSLPEASELLSQAARLMSQAYEDALRKMQLAGATLYREQFQSDSQIWPKCEAEWGQGSGYRERIADHSSDWFWEQPRLELEADILRVLSHEWAALLDRIGSIFDTT